MRKLTSKSKLTIKLGKHSFFYHTHKYDTETSNREENKNARYWKSIRNLKTSSLQQTAYQNLMVTTNQKSTVYIHTIKKKEFKHSIKDSHQIMRREPKRKGRKKDLPKKYKAINRV